MSEPIPMELLAAAREAWSLATIIVPVGPTVRSTEVPTGSQEQLGGVSRPTEIYATNKYSYLGSTGYPPSDRRKFFSDTREARLNSRRSGECDNERTQQQ